MKYETLTDQDRADVVRQQLNGVERQHLALTVRKDAGEEGLEDAIAIEEERAKKLKAAMTADEGAAAKPS